MSNQDKINLFLFQQSKLIKESIEFSFDLIPAQPKSKDAQGRPYITYSYGIVVDPICHSIWECTKKLSDKVMEKLGEMKNDKPSLNEGNYIKLSFREYPTFRIEGDRLQVTFRCLPYVFEHKLPDAGA